MSKCQKFQYTCCSLPLTETHTVDGLDRDGRSLRLLGPWGSLRLLRSAAPCGGHPRSAGLRPQGPASATRRCARGATRSRAHLPSGRGGTRAPEPCALPRPAGSRAGALRTASAGGVLARQPGSGDVAIRVAGERGSARERERGRGKMVISYMGPICQNK